MCKAHFHSLPLRAVFFLGLASLPVQAQITPDATLPNNSIVLPDDNLFTIEGGTQAGTNLFHSFEDFSIPTGGEAFFNNAVSIDNIITRVTGGNISDIDGLIRANSTANLFLMNPNGIQFGPNARLEIGGSFLGSTAESLLFEDGSFYSATETSTPPLLTVNVPVGLQMGENPGNLTVRGTGHRLNSGTFTPIDSSNNPIGLQVNPNRTLALIGGNIHLNGGLLRAESGHVELGSVRSGTVNWDGSSSIWQFDYHLVEEFSALDLSGQAGVDASGTPAGSIYLPGRQIRLDEGSVVWLQNLGTESSGAIVVNASESLELRGLGTTQFPNSTLTTESVGEGNGGNIVVSARELHLQDGGAILTRVFGVGQGGNVTTEVAESITVDGFSAINLPLSTAIATNTVGSGSAGDVIISARRLHALNGASISSITLGVGNSGNTVVNVTDTIEVVGINPIVSSPTVIAVSSFNRGDAGEVTVNTSRLRVLNGGAIASATLSEGDAGNATIDASEFVEVRGIGAENIESTVNASGQILPPIFQEAFGLPPFPTGNSGNLVLNTPVLQVSDGGVVSAAHRGTGDAGFLQIDSNEILLDRAGELSASTVSGEGGNIILNIRDSLQLRNGSIVDAESFDLGNGGNVTINSDTIALLENSQINASAIEGMGGNIEITTSGLFASPDSQITASSQFGVDGTVSINNPIVDPASGLVTLSTDPLNANTQLQDSCDIATRSRFAITGNGGLPPDPTEFFRGQTVWRDTRLGEIQIHLTPNPAETEPGEASTPSIPLVEATGWITNDRGQIELVAASGNTSYSSWQSHPDCDSVSQDSLDPDSWVR